MGTKIFLSIRSIILFSLLFFSTLYGERIGVIGTGYVGLVLGAGLSELGHEIVCGDVCKEKIDALSEGKIPIYEPGLKEIVEKNVKEKRLSFTTDIAELVKTTDIIYIAVGTPSKENGEADISALESVADVIGTNINGFKTIVIKSTVPIGTTRYIENLIREKAPQSSFEIAFNPEFLREGHAVSDFFFPDRIVIGSEEETAKDRMEKVWEPLKEMGGVVFIKTDVASSEMIKYAANAFLATKISFINELSHLCEVVNANVLEVAKGIGLDKRIGEEFLKPGPGYGGSCFPKDTCALLYTAKSFGIDLKIIEATIRANAAQKKALSRKIRKLSPELKGKKISVLGLAFKADTDDIRSSPSIDLIEDLLKEGAEVTGYDPLAESHMRQLFPQITYAKNLKSALKGADLIIVMTESEEFANLDLFRTADLVNQQQIMDARNLFEPTLLQKAGFTYENMGRK